jgi:hypothetical protein
MIPTVSILRCRPTRAPEEHKGASIVVNLCGGLGNQLFQYATGRAVSERLRTGLQLDVSWFAGPQRVGEIASIRRSFQLDRFHIPAAVQTIEVGSRPPQAQLPRWRRFIGRLRGSSCNPQTVHREKSLRFDPAVFTVRPGARLEGYWQSERYFREFHSPLCSELTPKDDMLTRQARDRISSLRIGGNRIVGVHVRRGDLAVAHEQLRDPTAVGLTLTPEAYYRSAMRLFPESVRFVICSDDLGWCRQRLADAASNVTFIDSGSALGDFETLRACDDVIISNSTFSWWAAWLNSTPDKRVICPEAWFDASFPLDYSLDDMIPAAWTRLSVE